MSICCKRGSTMAGNRAVRPYSMRTSTSSLLYRGVEDNASPLKKRVDVLAVSVAIHCPVPSGKVHAPAQQADGTDKHPIASATQCFNTLPTPHPGATSTS